MDDFLIPSNVELFSVKADNDMPVAKVCNGIKQRWFWHNHKWPHLSDYVREILSAFAVALTLVPESVAFSLMANVHPTIGVQTTWMVLLCSSLFGNRVTVVEGITGASASIIGSLSKSYCPNGVQSPLCDAKMEILCLSVILGGLIMFLFSISRLSRFATLIPLPVIIGFSNGLAIIIATSQLHAFEDQNGQWLSGLSVLWVFILCLVSFAIVEFWPMIPKVGKLIPAPLVSMAICVLIEFFIFRSFGASTLTVGQTSPFGTDVAIPKPFFINSDYSMQALRSALSTFEGHKFLWLQGNQVDSNYNSGILIPNSH